MPVPRLMLGAVLSLAMGAPVVALAQEASSARHVRLCPAGEPDCVEAPLATMTEEEEALDVFVTDAAGAPVAGVPVEVRETGPAAFSTGDPDAVLATTGEDGRATVTLMALEGGESSVVAEIGPAGDSGGFRGPGAQDDACEQPAGPGGSPPAGNCTTAALRIHWEEEPPPHHCSDGVDNDGDGFVDYPQDPGCTDEYDDEETPEPAPHLSTERHPRRINMRFRDRAGDEGLVISGRLGLVDENDRFQACTQDQPVQIQRRRDGEWKTKKQVSTNARGRYAAAVYDRPGRYRAVAVRTEVPTGDDLLHVCGKARKAKTHHHRR